MFESGGDPRETARAVERYYGKYPALVVEERPPPPPEKPASGEILVEVPGILEETPDGSGRRPIRVLARPCLPPGFFFVPEPGSRVWVEFAAGDVNSPLWSGVWYPPNATPKTVDGELPARRQKIIRREFGELWQVVQLDDEGIKISDSHGNAVTLNSSGIRLETTGSSIALDASGVKVSDGTGKQNRQFVLLEHLLEVWIKKHQHTGNLGSPTPPFPADITALEQMAKKVKSGK